MADYKPPFHLTEEIMSLAMEIGESIGTIMVDSTMSPDPKLRRESRVRSIYSSLAIEQTTLSLDQVTAVIDGKRILGPPKDIREVKNAEHKGTVLLCMKGQINGEDLYHTLLFPRYRSVEKHHEHSGGGSFQGGGGTCRLAS